MKKSIDAFFKEKFGEHPNDYPRSETELKTLIQKTEDDLSSLKRELREKLRCENKYRMVAAATTSRLFIYRRGLLRMGARDMKPGRELDALIAEKVMGFWDTHAAQYGETPVPPYSTDIAAAWQVTEKFEGVNVLTHKNGWQVQLVPRNSKLAYDVHIANGTTAAHAICLAALKAKGISDQT